MKSKILDREIVFPLWKNRFSNNDICLIRNKLVESQEWMQYDLEIVICFAEWWRTAYNGGTPSIHSVEDFVGLTQDKRKEFYQIAKKKINQLNSRGSIQLLHKTNNLYFRTLLFQGGLPLKLITGQNFSNYKKFLIGLVDELKDFDGWDEESIELIDNLNCVSYIRDYDSDDIRSLSLLIAKAIIHEDLNELPFDVNDNQFSDLLEAMKEVASQKSRPTPILVIWELVIRDGIGYWQYYLDLPSVIDARTFIAPNSIMPNTFTIGVYDRAVAKYRKCGTNFQRIAEQPYKFRWNGEKFIEVKAKAFGIEEFFPSVRNNYAPETSYPIVLSCGYNCFSTKKYSDCRKILLYNPAEWQCENENETVCLNGENYRYVYFTDIVRLTAIEDKHEETFDSSRFLYDLEYKIPEIPWIRNSNFNVISQFPKVKVFDSNQDLVKCKISYRSSLEKEWHNKEFNSILPTGVVFIRTLLPSGSYKVDRFYNVGSLDLNVSKENRSAILEFLCDWGDVWPLKQDMLDIVKDGNRFHLSREESTMIPSFLKFRIIKPDTPVLEFNVSTPFTSFYIHKNYGTRDALTSTDVISASALYNYTILENNYNNPRVILQYNAPDPNYDGPNLCYRVPLSGSINLIELKDYIDELFYMNFHRYETESLEMRDGVSIQVGNSRYLIQKYSVYTTFREGKITLSGEDSTYVSEIKVAIRSNGETNFTVCELRNESSGQYIINDYDCTKEYVVFTAPESLIQIQPKRYLPDYNSELVPELIEGNEDLWNLILSDYSFITEYRLPFGLFSELYTVASSPKLLSDFLFRQYLILGNDKSNIASFYGEYARMEREFAVSFHWIKYQYWSEVLYRHINIDIQSFVDFLTTLLDISNGRALNKYVLGLPVQLKPSITNEVFNQLRQCEQESSQSYYTQNVAGQMDIPTYRFSSPSRFFLANFADISNFSKTLLQIPLYICEHLVINEHPQLWTKIRLRCIIRYVQENFSKLYDETLNEILN